MYTYTYIIPTYIHTYIHMYMAPLSMGILQVRILEWAALSSSRI